MMALDNEKFILKQTEWRGEVTAKLDNINEDVLEIKKDIKEVRTDIKNLNRRLDLTNVKVATIAGTVSVIATIVTATVINTIG